MNKILVNTFLLSGANFFMKFVAYLYFLLLARSFSTEEVGLYALLITNYMFIDIAANLGLDKIIIRDMAKEDEDQANSILFMSLGIRIVAAAISLGVFTLVYFLFFPEIWSAHLPEIFMVMAAAFPMVLSRSIENRFTALEQMHFPAISQTLERLTLLVAAGMVTFGWLEFRGFVFAFFCAALLRAAFLAAVHPWKRWQRNAKSAASRFRPIIEEALRMVVVEAMALIYFRIDIIMLSKMTDLGSTGVYQVAYKIFDFFIALFAGFLIALFPKISREGDRFTLMRYLWLGALAMVVIAAPIILARDMILAMFSQEFVKGSTVLMLLMMTLPFVYWNSMLANFAIAVKRIGLLIRLAIILVTLNIGLNLVLIPKMSINGAAAATLICEAVSSLLVIFTLRVYIFRGSRQSEIAEGPNK